MQLSNASSMYSSGSRQLRLSRLGWRFGPVEQESVQLLVGVVDWHLTDVRRFAGPGVSLVSSIESCHLVCGPRVRGCRRRVSWPPADFDFRAALWGRPRHVPRGLLRGCASGNNSVAAGASIAICEIDRARACGSWWGCGGRLAFNISATLYHLTSSIWPVSVAANEGSFWVEETTVV